MSFIAFSEPYNPTLEACLQKHLHFELSDPRYLLANAMRYSVMAPGKRIRPLLALAVFQLFSSDIDRILPLACAVELIHVYSLIHDDLTAMDDDDYRRGQLTCHKKFGEDIAVLAGDTLNTYAFELLAQELPRYYSLEKTLHVIREFAQALGILGMAGGQVLDLKSPEAERDVDYLETTHRLKTGVLLKTCIVLPAYLEDASATERAYLAQFGEHLGMLFQIVDDILDVVGSQDELGKSIQKDIAQNKLTYVSYWGLDKARSLAQAEADAALVCLDAIRPRSSAVLEDLIGYLTQRTS